MIKRPVNERFKRAVLSGRKYTTIRQKVWPVGAPIMLYHWSGKAYRSEHVDICPVKVLGWWPIEISHLPGGEMSYDVGMEHNGRLFSVEGFESQDEMDEWFRPLVSMGAVQVQMLMRFRILSRAEAQWPEPRAAIA